MKREHLILALFILLLVSGICGCGLQHHDTYKDSSNITEYTVQQIRELLLTEEDFWIYVGEKDDQECIDFQWELDQYLTKNNKTILSLNTAVSDEAELEALEQIWDQLGFEEEEEVHAVLHLSNGYRIKRYDINTKDEVKAFKTAYAEDHITSNDHISRISVTEYREKLANQESFWIYMGRPTCYTCRVCYRWLIKTLEENNKDMNYLLADKKYQTEEEAAYMDELVEIINDNTIPIILYVENGEIDTVYSLTSDEEYEFFVENFKAQ